MLVGLGTARVINLRQVMGVIIGTAVGSTLTVQIMSLNLGEYSLPTLFFAFMVWLITKKPEIKNIMLAIIGFSFLFLGLSFIATGAKGIANEELLKHSLQQLANHDLLNFAFATLFCAFVHSSAVTIGLAMSLAQANVISLEQAMYWVYGANVGTTSTALMSAAGSNYIGRQVAWAHFFYKAVSAAIFLLPPVNSALTWSVSHFTLDSFRGIANAHLWFNLISAILFFPFTKKGAHLIETLFPKDSKDEFGSEFLKLNNYSSPALAVAYAQREILRVADIVISMIRDSIQLFENFDPIMVESIRERDRQVDFLYREIKHFLLDHANRNPTGVERHIMGLITFLTDIERAADAVDINLVQLAIKKHNLKLMFSDQGAKEIRMMFEQCLKTATIAINAFTEKNLCEEAINQKRQLAKLEVELRERHIERLQKGVKETINTSSIHLDALSEYRRVGSLLSSHAYSAFPKYT
jgi:phosphate:Na+ symporter